MAVPFVAVFVCGDCGTLYSRKKVSKCPICGSTSGERLGNP